MAPNLRIKISTNPALDRRRYNEPSVSEVAVLIVDGDDQVGTSRDIVLRPQSGGFQRIAETHPSYDALSYPLLFPHGEQGWHPGLTQSAHSNSRLTLRQWISYHLFSRANRMNVLHVAGKVASWKE
jgi:hypothetical protein